MHRRGFLQSIAVGTAGLALGDICGAERPKAALTTAILSAPLTHSDWMLKAGMKWGKPGVEHLLDA
jgi:hypothetical protein